MFQFQSSLFSLSQVKYDGPQVESQKSVLWITGPQHFLDDGGNLESFEVSAIVPVQRGDRKKKLEDKG